MTEVARAPMKEGRPARHASRRRTSWFFLVYLQRELRRRLRQAVTIALGLAVGIGLVMIIAATTAGVGNAQNAVLRSLYGVGTDLTVTTPAHPSGSSGGPTPEHPGTLLLGDLGLLRSSSVTDISRLHGVASAVGELNLTEIKQSGKTLPVAVSVGGVDIAHLRIGPFGSGTLASGRSFTATDAAANDAVVDSRYAATNHVAVGSIITLGGARFHVIGITRQTQGGNGADIYIPLGRAQALTHYQNLKNLTGWVNVIYVTATSAAQVAAVQHEIAGLLPAAMLASSASLANAVHGSLASAASLASDLGRWVAITALIAACAITSLLTMAAVARRTREIGTLKALGWRSRRIMIQIMSESIVTGAIGALIGVAIGFAGVAVVNSVAPELTASAANPQNVTGSTPAVAVHLTAHVSAGIILLAIALSVGGALIAGSFGARRAARLQPADAFAQIT